MMDRQSYWYCHRQIDRYKSMIYWSVAAWSNHQRPGVNSKESSTDSTATEKIQRRRWSFEKTERQRWSLTSVHHLVDATKPDVLRLFNEYVEEDFSEFRNHLYCNCRWLHHNDHRPMWNGQTWAGAKQARIIVVKMKLLGFALLLLVTTTTAPIVGKLAFIREIPLAATCSRRKVMQFFFRDWHSWHGRHGQSCLWEGGAFHIVIRLDICRDPGTSGPVKFFLTV